MVEFAPDIRHRASWTVPEHGGTMDIVLSDLKRLGDLAV